MKILLVGFAKVKYMPYVNFYLDSIDRKKHEVHLIYWNRDLKDEDLSAYEGITMHEFRCYQEDNVSKGSKIGSFVKYRRFVKNVLRKNKIDHVILLHSMPAVLLSGTWTKKFKDRYFFDYRDSTFERYSFYQKIIWRLVRGSRATFTSSDGFRKFFPADAQDKVFTTHNILTDSLAHREYEKSKSDKIRIAFWGFMRGEAVNREIIKRIAADDRLELHFYGREQKIALNLKAYAAELGTNNIVFHGEYSPEERYEFVKNTDLIHNIYNTANMMLAMGNKYYDGPIFYIPQLCMKGSFMEKCASEAGIGLSCDPFCDGFTDSIVNYYSDLDREEFKKNCDAELERIVKQYDEASGYLREAFK